MFTVSQACEHDWFSCKTWSGSGTGLLWLLLPVHSFVPFKEFSSKCIFALLLLPSFFFVFSLLYLCWFFYILWVYEIMSWNVCVLSFYVVRNVHVYRLDIILYYFYCCRPTKQGYFIYFYLCLFTHWIVHIFSLTHLRKCY